MILLIVCLIFFKQQNKSLQNLKLVGSCTNELDSPLVRSAKYLSGEKTIGDSRLKCETNKGVDVQKTINF